MYVQWTSLSSVITNNSAKAKKQSVLNKFSRLAGREIAVSVVKQLAGSLGITQSAEPSKLESDFEVQWCLEVICFGLSLPLSEHETIKDCVNVYCEWLSALHPLPKLSVPKPITEDPNVYARTIINHFHNLFVPRPGEGADTINRQAVMCHRVLRTIQHTTQMSQILTRETWESILLFLLAINEILLAPPIVKDDVGDQICERVLSVLFEVWLLACVRSFPSPSLWKTLKESCKMWRHRIALVEQWNRVNLALTARLLEFTYGSEFTDLNIMEEDASLIPKEMTNDCIAQTWYRFLRILDSPIELCYPSIISQTDHFMQHCLLMENGIEPHQHPCLLSLPQIFLKAIEGISNQVNAFLGFQFTSLPDENHIDAKYIQNTQNVQLSSSTQHIQYRFSDATSQITRHGNSGGAMVSLDNSPHMDIGSTSSCGYGGLIGSTIGVNHDVPHSLTPPLQRSLSKSFSVAPAGLQNKGLPKTSYTGLTGSKSSITSKSSSGQSSTNHTPLISNKQNTRMAQTRPKCNSILNLFGEWLFEAALIGSETWLENIKKEATEAGRRPASIVMDSRKGSLSLSQPSSLSESKDLPPELTIKYDLGRAAAIGTICRILCAKKTGEEFSSVYLARCYMALHQGLRMTEKYECEETLVSILFNSSDLFRVDLDGVQVLIPSFITALELVLPDKDIQIKSSPLNVNKTELRRASIQILLSIITLPLNFKNLAIRDLAGHDKITFIKMKPRLINIIMNALQVESDSQNTHMLLGGLFLIVQDAAIFEETEIVTDILKTSPPCSDLNLLSSACSENSAGSVASANINVGGSNTTHDTAILCNDQPSLTLTDEFPADFFQDNEMICNDNAHALFVRVTYLVCHRLISSWRMDLNVSLAALELLSGLARMHIKDSEALECKRAVKWICDYICYQCSRPPPAHSKDLHSSIVAAFQCCSAWLMQHPYLLQDKDCLTTVLEVVELGISGSKSIGKPGEKIKYKNEKDLKPASMRVRDASENLLTIILEQIGYFPNDCGPQSLSSLLDEIALIKHCNSDLNSIITQDDAIQKFKYFVTENSTVLALLEEPLGNDQDPQPSVTLLIRGPFGRHAWTMQLRHLPRSKSGKKYHAPNPGRPIPMNELMQRNEIEQKYFPDGVEKIMPCVADYTIPVLEDVIDKVGIDPIKLLSNLLENQTVREKLAWAETDSSTESLSHSREAVPFPVCHEFQAARLFLSHFGFLSLNSNTFGGAPAPLIISQLTALDSTKEGFSRHLSQLDKMSSRTCDTAHIFYVKAGQNNENEILSNMELENVYLLDPNFWIMIYSLGWPVTVKDHSGWTGFINSSWNINPGRNDKTDNNYGNVHPMNFDGENQIIYWADVESEIAFIIPSKNDLTKDVNISSVSSETSSTYPSYEKNVNEILLDDNVAQSYSKVQINHKPLTLDVDKQTSIFPSHRRTCATKSHLQIQSTTKILIVWLESYEDYLTFPTDSLLNYTITGEEQTSNQYSRSADVHIIFLHALTSNLLRVKLHAPSGRMNFATPLVDGMVISHRVVGPIVRQTVYNMTRRRRLDNDVYQSPHVRRRLKVQDLIQKYPIDMSTPQLLSNLF